MAIEAVSANVPLKAGARLAGLNHVAELRARYWGDSWKEVERVVDDMRDKRDPQFEENTRALAAIFFLAKIPAARHELELSELTTEEKKALITAMNHFRAVVSLFPKRLTMPNKSKQKFNGVNPPGFLLPEIRRNKYAERTYKHLCRRK